MDSASDAGTFGEYSISRVRASAVSLLSDAIKVFLDNPINTTRVVSGQSEYVALNPAVQVTMFEFGPSLLHLRRMTPQDQRLAALWTIGHLETQLAAAPDTAKKVVLDALARSRAILCVIDSRAAAKITGSRVPRDKRQREDSQDSLQADVVVSEPPAQEMTQACPLEL